MAIGLTLITGFPATANDEPRAVHFPERLSAAVLALPELRQAVVDAEATVEDARQEAVHAFGVHIMKRLRAKQAQVTLNQFARTTYVAGMPSRTGVLLAQWEGSVGALLHDMVLQQAAGTDQAFRALSIKDEADTAQSEERSTTEHLTLMRQLLEERRAHLHSTETELVQLATQIGYPELTLAALSVGADGCARSAPSDSNPQGILVGRLCRTATANAAPESAAAIRWAFARLGAPYACAGAGRTHPLFQFDCSSFVSRAYQDGAGVLLWSGGDIPSTSSILAQTSRFRSVPVGEMRVGDLVLYDTCVPDQSLTGDDARQSPLADGDSTGESATCDVRHVVIYLGRFANEEWMIHTSSCGKGVTVEPFWGTADDPGQRFLAVTRVVP